MNKITITENDKKRFSEFSLDGGVMDTTNTIKFLYYCAELALEQGLNYDTDHEAVGEIVKDLMDYAQMVEDDKETNYWKIAECPMSASNIHLTAMTEKEYREA